VGETLVLVLVLLLELGGNRDGYEGVPGYVEQLIWIPGDENGRNPL